MNAMELSFLWRQEGEGGREEGEGREGGRGGGGGEEEEGERGGGGEETGKGGGGGEDSTVGNSNWGKGSLIPRPSHTPGYEAREEGARG